GGRVGLDLAADVVAEHVGQVDVEQDQLGGGGPFQGLPPGPGLDHGVPGPVQPGSHQVALGLVVVDEQHDGLIAGHDGLRMIPRRVNSSRSRVSSSLRSMAAARGGGGTSAPVMMIAGTVAGSRASSALPSMPGIRMSASIRSTGS